MSLFRGRRVTEPQPLLSGGTILTACTLTFLIALQLAGVRVSALNAVSVYLLLTLLSSLRFGLKAGLGVAAASTVLINFFFLDPLFALHMSEMQHLASLPVFFIVAIVGAWLRPDVSAAAAASPAAVPAPAAVLNLGGLHVDLGNHLVFVDGREVRLTPTEFRLLHCFVVNPGKVLRPTAILEQVWGKAYTKDVRILRTYVNQLRAKLNDSSSSPRFIRTEPGFGYRLLTGEEAAPPPPEAASR